MGGPEMGANAAAIDARRKLLEKMLRGEGAAATPQAAAIGPRDPARPIPLTHEQNQLWLHAQMAPDVPIYNESITIHRLGRYHHAALEWALSEVIRRHTIWRTRFSEEDGVLTQHVEPATPVTLPLIDISHLDPDAREAEARRLATEDAQAPIAFDRAPLLRARVVKLGEENHRLYLTLHHIIFDGVSIYRTLVPELAALVDAFERGATSPLPEPALQYADYAVWQADHRGADAFERHLAHWRIALAEPLPRLEVAGDRPRPVVPTHAGAMEVFALPETLVERLRGLARAEGATLYMVLLAAYKAMLFRYTGETDIIVGGVTDTRSRPELQPLMGYFLNTMALRSHPAGARPFRDYLAEVKASVIGALGASDIPFDKLVRALDIKRGSGTHPLFNTLFSIQPPIDALPDGWDLTQMDVSVGGAKYDLYLELEERTTGLDCRFLYSSELFEVATIRRMIGHWTRMLEGIAADPATPLARLPMLGEDERRMIAGWNATARPLPHASVVDWFAEQAARHAQDIAIEQEGERWTYAELDARADAIAARLIAEGVTPGALVGLALNRSPWMVAAMLGIARAGAAYLPLDPGFPPARLAMIVESAAPALVLVEHGTEKALPPGGARLLRWDRDWPVEPYDAPAIDGEALAYVLYTSGSTGKPKGVEIPHAALANLLMAMQAEPGFAEGESLLAVTTLSFDIAGLELWLPLVSGGRVVIAPREAAVDMTRLIALIEQSAPDVMQATPATWRGLIEAGWRGAPDMRVLCGGEKLPRALADLLLPRVAELWNMYGPTETTIWSTVRKVEGGAWAIPIGTPIANTEVRVLDEAGNDLPVGAIGEILIGGRGLALGYRGRPDLTAERFVRVNGTRLYRTGDLGRWRADGMLECLGRTDNEEKIRGFRIAIEEVEGALAKLPGVSATSVKAWPDASGERALVGYIVGPGDAAGWRDALSAILPDYMIPTRFVAMDALPLTPNGKVDRKQLPSPDVSAAAPGEPPATPEEQRLAEIWQTVLKVDVVNRHDDFFDLGGHSLLVARLLRRIEAEYGMKLAMAALFRAPTLAGMAELIASGRPVEAPAVIPIQPDGDRPAILWLDGGSTFLPLTEQLGREQPFFGISVDAVLDAAGGCPRRFEDAARLVVAAIKEAQPSGPYWIGGWCTSGILAYAVADEMRRRGESVPLLMMVHTSYPARARAIGAVRIFISKFRFHITQSLSQAPGRRFRYFVERLRGLSDAVALRGGREAVLQPKLRTQLDHAALHYDPPRYPGDVILFQPTEHPDVLDFFDDWASHIDGRFDPHVVPGGHRTMLEHPHVASFARLLQAALDRSRSGGR